MIFEECTISHCHSLFGQVQLSSISLAYLQAHVHVKLICLDMISDSTVTLCRGFFYVVLYDLFLSLSLPLSLSLSLCSELVSGTLSSNNIEDGTEIRLVPAVESGVTVCVYDYNCV